MLIKDKTGTPRCSVADPDKDLLFKGNGYRLYLASTPDGTRTGFLRLPDHRRGNAIMQMEVEKLNHIAAASAQIEAEYQNQENAPNARVHYDWLVPELVDSFVCDKDQKFRQGNLIAAKDAELKDFYALPKLMSKYKIDTKTAAWILGRFFKFQTFTEVLGLDYSFLPDQVVIEPRAHRMIYLGLYLPEVEPGWDNVAHASKCILDFVKADEESPEDMTFMKNLRLLATPTGMSGAMAHRTLYAVITKYWGHKYHPFTYFDLATETWHSLSDAEILHP